MNVQNPILAEVISQMFANSHHPLQLSPVNHRRIRKPPLRPIHPNSSPAKSSKVPLSPSMNLISLRHPARPPKQKRMATESHRRHRKETNSIPNQKKSVPDLLRLHRLN